MIDIKTLRAMALAGASVDVILAAVEAELVAEGARVQAGRDLVAARQQRWRDKRNGVSRTVTSNNVTSQESLSSSSSSSLETTTSDKKVSKKERARKSLLPDDWLPKPSHYAKGDKFHVEQKADDMRNWAKSKAVMRADWDATFHGFLRPREGTQNGFGGPRPLQNDSLSVGRAAARLEGEARAGNFHIAPRPNLLPAESPPGVRVLSKG